MDTLPLDPQTFRYNVLRAHGVEIRIRLGGLTVTAMGIVTPLDNGLYSFRGFGTYPTIIQFELAAVESYWAPTCGLLNVILRPTDYPSTSNTPKP